MVQELLKAIEGLPVDEKRSLQSDYIELVFMAGDMDKWDAQIASVLGPAAKPKGEKPTKEDDEAASHYGGIGQDQVLYRKDAGGERCVAMMWPWRDGEHITLKAARIAAAADEPKSAPDAEEPQGAPASGPDPRILIIVGVLAVIAVLTAIYAIL